MSANKPKLQDMSEIFAEVEAERAAECRREMQAEAEAEKAVADLLKRLAD